MATIDKTEARLSAHEQVCAERYATITLQFDANNARLKRIEQILIVACGAIITMLVNLVMKLS